MADLAGLPNEDFELIVTFLDLDDVRDLRLTSREISEKTNQAHFKSFFRRKHVDLTRDGLEAFVSATQDGGLGCMVQELTLADVVYNSEQLAKEVDLENTQRRSSGLATFDSDDDESSSDDNASSSSDGESEKDKAPPPRAKSRNECYLEMFEARHKDLYALRSSHEDVALLGQALQNIVAHSKTGHIASLALSVVQITDDLAIQHRHAGPFAFQDIAKRVQPNVGYWRWQSVWQAASHNFRTTLAALSTSQLRVKHFDIFGHVERCSLPSDMFTLAMPQPGIHSLGPFLQSLRSLTISFSDDSMEVRNRRRLDIIAYPTGLARFLAKCTELQHLDLHFYGLGYRNERSEVVRAITEMVKLSKLESLTLRGVQDMREVDLMTFVENARLRSIQLHHIKLRQGTFRALYRYCRSPEAGVQKVYFRGLSEGDKCVYFDRPKIATDDRTEPSSCDDIEDVHALDVETVTSDILQREGEEVRALFRWRCRRRSEVDSPMVRNRRKFMIAQYGPPR